MADVIQIDAGSPSRLLQIVESGGRVEVSSGTTRPGLVLPETARHGGTNEDAFDFFTAVHFGAGVALGIFGAPWWAIVGGALTWELIERPLERRIPGGTPESTKNAIVDVGVALTGAALAMRVAGGMKVVNPAALYLSVAPVLAIADGRKAVDPGTFFFLGVGAALRHFGAPWWLIIGGALGWELAERPLRKAVPQIFTHDDQDSVPNAIADVSAVTAGAALMQLYMR